MSGEAAWEDWKVSEGGWRGGMAQCEGFPPTVEVTVWTGMYQGWEVKHWPKVPLAQGPRPKSVGQEYPDFLQEQTEVAVQVLEEQFCLF